MDALMLKNVSKTYGKFTALSNISLSIPPGTFGLLGPNGAGKTTLMRILTTLIPPTSGGVCYGKIDWRNPVEVRGILGYLPQKFGLYKHIRVREALEHIAVLKGLGNERKKLVGDVIEKVNLTDQQHKKIGQLSGGMVRRLGIAQAILGDPKIIIIDEPTAGLDPEERIRFRNMLRQLGTEKIIIISTHIVEDIEAICDHAAVLNRGNIVVQGDICSLRKAALGKIWEINVPLSAYQDISPDWMVVSSNRINDIYKLRIIADNAPGGSTSVEPTLEESYLHLVRCVS